MKTLGNVVMIQRGETWSLDFEVTNAAGQPYMLFKEWTNPYLAITVTAARYSQKGDFRRTWWLDMDRRWVEQSDGSFVIVPMKRFTETEPLYTQYHQISQVMATYGPGFGRIVADGDPSNPFDVTNYLFFTDPDADGNLIFKYVSDYILGNNSFTVTEVWYQTAPPTYDCVFPEWDAFVTYPAGTRVRYNNELYIACIEIYDEITPSEDSRWINISPYHWVTFHNLYDPEKSYVRGDLAIHGTIGKVFTGTWGWIALTGDYSNVPYVESETWEEYNFRIIKQFNTKDWVEQNYLFDIKLLAGETIEEHIRGILVDQETPNIPDLPWTDETTREQIKRITDWKVRKQMQEYFDGGAPLMPDFDTKSLVLEPTKLIVSANIQGGGGIR